MLRWTLGANQNRGIFVQSGFSANDGHDGATVWLGNEAVQSQCEVVSMGDCSLKLRQFFFCTPQFSRSCGSGAQELRFVGSSENPVRYPRKPLLEIRAVLFYPRYSKTLPQLLRIATDEFRSVQRVFCGWRGDAKMNRFQVNSGA
jgi:hypothetical protein